MNGSFSCITYGCKHSETLSDIRSSYQSRGSQWHVFHPCVFRFTKIIDREVSLIIALRPFGRFFLEKDDGKFLEIGKRAKLVAYLLKISKELDHFDGVLRAFGIDLNLGMLSQAAESPKDPARCHATL